MANDQDLGDDFSYMLRMADTDIDGLKPLRTALTAVRGVGDRTAANICTITGFDPSMKAGHLDASQQETLREAIENYAQNVPLWMLYRQRDLETGDELHLSGQDLNQLMKTIFLAFVQSSATEVSATQAVTRCVDSVWPFLTVDLV